MSRTGPGTYIPRKAERIAASYPNIGSRLELPPELWTYTGSYLQPESAQSLAEASPAIGRVMRQSPALQEQVELNFFSEKLGDSLQDRVRGAARRARVPRQLIEDIMLRCQVPRLKGIAEWLAEMPETSRGLYPFKTDVFWHFSSYPMTDTDPPAEDFPFDVSFAGWWKEETREFYEVCQHFRKLAAVTEAQDLNMAVFFETFLARIPQRFRVFLNPAIPLMTDSAMAQVWFVGENGEYWKATSQDRRSLDVNGNPIGPLQCTDLQTPETCRANPDCAVLPAEPNAVQKNFSLTAHDIERFGSANSRCVKRENLGIVIGNAQLEFRRTDWPSSMRGKLDKYRAMLREGLEEYWQDFW